MSMRWWWISVGCLWSAVGLLALSWLDVLFVVFDLVLPPWSIAGPVAAAGFVIAGRVNRGTQSAVQVGEPTRIGLVLAAGAAAFCAGWTLFVGTSYFVVDKSGCGSTVVQYEHFWMDGSVEFHRPWGPIAVGAGGWMVYDSPEGRAPADYSVGAGCELTLDADYGPFDW